MFLLGLNFLWRCTLLRRNIVCTWTIRCWFSWGAFQLILFNVYLKNQWEGHLKIQSACLFSFNILYLSLMKRQPSLFINSCLFQSRARALVLWDIVILYSLSVFPSLNKLVLHMCKKSELLFSLGQQLAITFLCKSKFISKESTVSFLLIYPVCNQYWWFLVCIWGLHKTRQNPGCYLFRLHPFLWVVSWTKAYVSVQFLCIAKKIRLKI